MQYKWFHLSLSLSDIYWQEQIIPKIRHLNVLPGQEKELQFLFSALKDPHKLSVFLWYLLLFLNFPVWSSESTSDFLTFPNRHSLRRSCWPPSQLWLQGLQSDQCDQPGNKIELFFNFFQIGVVVNFFQVYKYFFQEPISSLDNPQERISVHEKNIYLKKFVIFFWVLKVC